MVLSRQRYRTSERAKVRLLKGMAVIVLVAGVFWQISSLAALFGQTKEISSLNTQLVQMSSMAENLQVTLNQYRNPEEIEARAQELGMVLPGEGQVRAINLD